MTTATVSLPPVTPAFQRAVREMAYRIGWRNTAKAIAYGPVLEVQAPTVPSNGNGHRRNGHISYGRPAKLPKGIKRNLRGGWACAAPGGYGEPHHFFTDNYPPAHEWSDRVRLWTEKDWRERGAYGTIHFGPDEEPA